MSEATPAKGIVLAHGSLAEGLVDAVRQIAGAGADTLVALSNRGLSPDALAAEVRTRLGPGPTIVFTDLPSGSCGFAARRLCHDLRDVVVVSGVNLPVLLDFVLHNELPLAELVARLLERGRAGICCAPADLENHVRRAVSGG